MKVIKKHFQEKRLVMDSTTLGTVSKAGQGHPPKQMQTLYRVCQQVVDGRESRGKRYELAGLLVVLVLAKRAGMQSMLGASEWIADQAALLPGSSTFEKPCSRKRWALTA
jgi:hypothetical protein